MNRSRLKNIYTKWNSKEIMDFKMRKEIFLNIITYSQWDYFKKLQIKILKSILDRDKCRSDDFITTEEGEKMIN